MSLHIVCVEYHCITHIYYDYASVALNQKHLLKISARENEIPDLSENTNSRLGEWNCPKHKIPMLGRANIWNKNNSNLHNMNLDVFEVAK